MPIVSEGRLVSTQATMAASSVTTYTPPFTYTGLGKHPLSEFLNHSDAYDAIYENNLWVKTVVQKLLGLALQIPRKVYQRTGGGRESVPRSAYGQLIARPSKDIDPYHFWGMSTLHYYIHGKAFLRKVRDRGGRPIELKIIHPSRMRYGPPGGGVANLSAFPIPSEDNRWWIARDDGTEVEIPARDLIPWLDFNPRHPKLGLSRLESLRQTLANEDAARRANAAQWINGGKPSFVLKHPAKFNNPMASLRLSNQFQTRHGGVDNWGRPLVLEEGMDIVPLESNNDLEYIATRRLNRDEVISSYDIPPPAVHVLDKATFSNIVEQHRAIYMLNMPPMFTSFEAMIDFYLRDGSLGDGPPDFGNSFYMEHLMDGVLRGSFEERVLAYSRMIQTAQVTPAEVRELENRPKIAGSDRLFLNGAVIPLDLSGAKVASGDTSTQVPTERTAGTSDASSALEPMNVSSLPPPSLESRELSKVMGRLSRPVSVDSVDVDALVQGLDDVAADAVRGVIAIARFGGFSMAETRRLMKELRL
jgi:HK97 family phage portal protein